MLARFKTRPTNYARLGGRLIDLDSLTYVEIRALVAVGLAQFFAKLGHLPLLAVKGSTLPGEMRGGVKKALRILRDKSVPFKWTD